ncbi:MAG: hypothetical protein M3Y87_14810 [Myxococcota bacterium]|nr:hypothetical protein [Myxococcota bacterium]
MRRTLRAHAIGLRAVALTALLLSACGNPARGGTRTALDVAAVDDETYEEVRREYLVLAADDPAREAVRGRLLEHLSTRSDALLADGDYDAIVSHLADMTELLAPSDLAEGSRLPQQLAPIARWVVEHGSRRGDEPRVLASLLLLSRIEPSDPAHLAEYERIATWGHDARWGSSPSLGGDFFDFAPALISVWEEHARLSPAPAVLDRLADLYVQMRNVVSGRSLEEGFAPGERISMPEMRMAQLLAERIPLDVAAVYLRVGDLSRAAERVGELGDRGGIEWRLRRLIEQAAGTGEEGAEALGELSAGFERARPDVSLALCRLGRRLHPDDPRFPLCLARLSAALDQAAEATAWYAEAVSLAPSDRDVYDEALGRLAQLIEGGLFGAQGQIGRIRMIGRHAESILEQRAARWPNVPAAVSSAELHYHLGRAEMHAGNAARAAEHLERSLAVRRSREAILELATLRSRTGDPAGAVVLYREALAGHSQQGEDG